VSLDSAGRFEAGTTTGKASFRLVAHNGVYHTVKVQVADYLHPTIPLSFAGSSWPALQEFSRVFPDPFFEVVEYMTAHDVTGVFTMNSEAEITNVQGEVQQVDPQLEPLLRAVLEPYPYTMWIWLYGKQGFVVHLIRNRDDGFQDIHTYGYGPSTEKAHSSQPHPHWYYSDNRLIQ
jgi:hypothetical protein